MLFNFTVGPVLYIIDWSSKVFVVLVLSTSIQVVLKVSISYPFTYAFPGEILYKAKFLDGVDPEYVNWPDCQTPLLPTLSFKEFKRTILKGFTW